MVAATISEVRKNFKSYCDEVESSGAPLRITRRGAQDMVLISEEEWDAIEETLWFAEDPNRMERLRQSERDEASGRVTEFASVADLRKAAMADA